MDFCTPANPNYPSYTKGIQSLINFLKMPTETMGRACCFFFRLPPQCLIFFYCSRGYVKISPGITISISPPHCHHLDLDLRPFWEPGDLHRSPGWIRTLEISLVDPIDSSKILHVCQVDPCLDNAGKIKPGLM